MLWFGNSKMKLQDALGRYLVQLEADGRSLHTRRQYSRHVTAFANWLRPRDDVTAVTSEDVAAFLASPAARRRPDGGLRKASTMNQHRGSLRGFFRYLHGAGILPENPARLVRRALYGPPVPRALSDLEQERLLGVLAEAPERDRVLFTLMLRVGLRVGSAVGLDVEDVDLDRCVLRLRGAKGDRHEEAVIPRAVCEHLRRLVHGQDSGPLFHGPGGQRLSTRHVQRRFARYAVAAGLATTSTHSLRHSFAMRIYQRTGDLGLTQRALRHRSIVSTVVYTSVPGTRLREALEAQATSTDGWMQHPDLTTARRGRQIMIRWRADGSHDA